MQKNLMGKGNKMSLFELFCTFFYIGLFTIGGGIVAITLMQQTIVQRGLITEEQFYNMVAISESTPGPLGTNMATYIGYNLYGIPGGVITTIGEVLPSLIIIVIIAKFLQKFNKSLYVKGALAFLRPVTTGLILVPVVQIFIFNMFNIPEQFSLSYLFSFENLKGFIDWINLAGYAVIFFLMMKFKMHPILTILLGALFGIIFL